MVVNISNIEPCAPLDQQPNYRLLSSRNGLVQRRRVRMSTDRRIPVRIHARIKKQANDVHPAVLRRQGKSSLPRLGVRISKQRDGLVVTPGSRGDDEIDLRAAPD